jgi:hypothetical protein
MTRRERRIAKRRTRRAGVAVAAVVGAGALALGGLAASGALPDVVGGGDTPSVPANAASQTGTNHAQAGISQAGTDHAQAGISQAGSNDSGDAGSQNASSALQGLQTAQSNVDANGSSVASAVIETLITDFGEGTTGSQLGADVSSAAQDAASQLLPTAPNEASDGLTHKP